MVGLLLYPIGVTQLNAQCQHQKKSCNSHGWFSHDYCARVGIAAAIHRRSTPLRHDESGNYNKVSIKALVGKTIGVPY